MHNSRNIDCGAEGGSQDPPEKADLQGRDQLTRVHRSSTPKVALVAADAEDDERPIGTRPRVVLSAVVLRLLLCTARSSRFYESHPVGPGCGMRFSYEMRFRML